MGDDLVKRLRNAATKRDGFDAVNLSTVAAARIEELEAKLAKAVKALESIYFESVGDEAIYTARAALEELKGYKT